MCVTRWVFRTATRLGYWPAREQVPQPTGGTCRGHLYGTSGILRTVRLFRSHAPPHSQGPHERSPHRRRAAEKAARPTSPLVVTGRYGPDVSPLSFGGKRTPPSDALSQKRDTLPYSWLEATPRDSPLPGAVRGDARLSLGGRPCRRVRLQAAPPRHGRPSTPAGPLTPSARETTEVRRPPFANGFPGRRRSGRRTRRREPDGVAPTGLSMLDHPHGTGAACLYHPQCPRVPFRWWGDCCETGAGAKLRARILTRFSVSTCS